MTPNSILLIISCGLSIVGASALLWDILRSAEKRNKPGSRLLAWLSFTDLCTSLTYSISAISNTKRNGDICTTQSVLAYYVYDIVVLRGAAKGRDQQENVQRMFFYFHCISWPIAALLCLLVVLTGHAGYENFLNTGGWCWVKLKDGTISDDDDNGERQDQMAELFIWEVIGGKGIEWLSCFVIVPIFYFLSFRALMELQRSQETKEEMMRATEVAAESMRNRTSSSSHNSKYIMQQQMIIPSPNTWTPARMRTASPVTNDDTMAYSISPPNRSKSSSSFPPLSVNTTLAALTTPLVRHDDETGQLVPQEPPSADANGSSNIGLSSNTTSSSVMSVYPLSSPSPVQRKMIDFSLFNTRLAVFPIVFVMIRLWGTLRVIIMFSYAMSGDFVPSIDWLGSMQAVFDPAQGLFNAILYFTFLRQEKKVDGSGKELQGQRFTKKYHDTTNVDGTAGGGGTGPTFNNMTTTVIGAATKVQSRLSVDTKAVNSENDFATSSNVIKLMYDGDLSGFASKEDNDDDDDDEKEGGEGWSDEFDDRHPSDLFTPLAGNGSGSFDSPRATSRMRRHKKNKKRTPMAVTPASSDYQSNDLGTPASQAESNVGIQSKESKESKSSSIDSDSD